MGLVGVQGRYGGQVPRFVLVRLTDRVRSPLPPALLARRQALRRDWTIGLSAALGAVGFFVLAVLWGGIALALGVASLACFAALAVAAVDAVRFCSRSR